MITKPTKIFVTAALSVALIITGCGSGDEKTESTTVAVPATDSIPPATDDTSSLSTGKPVGTPNN